MHGEMTQTPAFAAAVGLGATRDGLPALCTRTAHHRARVTMLRVRKDRRPDDWEQRQASLSGRFLPLDPKDEFVLDIVEGSARVADSPDDDFGEDGPPASAYAGAAQPGRPRKWSRRADAARRRWADPAFRGMMLEKRAEKRRQEEEGRKKAITIGCMDSITLCDDDKAKQINDYVRSNRLKSEKITAYHADRRSWMEDRLSQGEDLRWRMNRVEYKKQRQEQRQEEARRRHKRMKAAKEMEKRKAAGELEETQP